MSDGAKKQEHVDVDRAIDQKYLADPLAQGDAAD